jgi:hypothetical protein
MVGSRDVQLVDMYFKMVLSDFAVGLLLCRTHETNLVLDWLGCVRSSVAGSGPLLLNRLLCGK